MKIIEEQKLKEVIELINCYHLDNDTFAAFHNLDNLCISSLQDISHQKDIEFFDEISFILSVISSIISHPHLSNRGEDIIIRAELAGSIPADAFNQVVKEPILWKEQGCEMVPENVHYYQYTDELRIYENVFIGMLITKLNQELSRYQEFYVSLIPSFDQNVDAFDADQTHLALTKIRRLQRKFRFIMNTHFYKEVSKVKMSFKGIQPTNILLKDRLYNFCFKFYRKFIKYEDREKLLEDFRTYYYHMILKVFKTHGFCLDESKSQRFNNLTFNFNDFIANVYIEENIPGIFLNVSSNGITVKHHLLLNLDRNNKDFVAKEFDDVCSTNVISLWNLNSLSDLNTQLFNNSQKEEEILEYWLMSKFKEVTANKDMYERYCPVCKSRSIDINQDLCSCSDCQSMYTFKNDNKIWFIRVRR
jgi:hypothetical protein